MKIDCHTALKYLFIIVAIVFIVSLIDFDEFMNLASSISFIYFAIVVLIVVFDQAFMGAKWHYLLRVFHVNVPISVPILAYLRGRIFMFVAPSSLGIDAYKAYCVNKYHKSMPPIVSSILVERAFGAMSSIAILFLLLPFCVEILEREGRLVEKF